jgi:intracellular multiplication protein IcmP
MILFVAGAFVIGLISFAVWHFFHLQITNGIRWLRVGELWIAKFIVGDNAVYPTDKGPMTVGQWRMYLPKTPVNNIKPEHLMQMTQVAVPPLRILFTIAIGLMGLYVIFFGYGSQYRRRMGLESLMREQARSFPSIRPFLKFDPRKQPFRAPGAPVPAQLPLFSEALSPEEWIAYHEVSVPGQGSRLDHPKAFTALSQQLGRRWEGPLKMPIHMQGLYAAFALKHVRKRKESEAILDAMSSGWSPEKGFNISPKVKAEIKRVIKDPKLGGALQKFADQHAYETTALLRCLARAREEGGVIAPAQFLWLRGFDRALWYPLNNLGRKAFHAEAAGAMVHYVNELIASQKIPTPRFDEVIKGLETYLKSGVGREIPELDRSAGGAKNFKKKKG